MSKSNIYSLMLFFFIGFSSSVVGEVCTDEDINPRRHKIANNDRPQFTSKSSAVITEGTPPSAVILDVDAKVEDGAVDAGLTYSLSGTDAALFAIDQATGALTFTTAPDWHNPKDADKDNIYELVVTATTEANTSTDQSLSIFVFPKNVLGGDTQLISTQLGADIDGEAEGDQSGVSVSLSADGSVVAIGANLNDGNGDNSGHVRIYGYDQAANAWQQLGADIDGEAGYDQSGFSVSLSADGSVVAIGAPGNDGNGISSGHVRIYGYDQATDAWQQLGAEIDGEAAGDQSGVSVSLSADGSVVAIGAYLNDGNGNTSGHVRIYGFDQEANAWQQLGADIDGEVAWDYSGVSVSLSADGSVVAIGAYGNDGNEETSGHVRIYGFDQAANAWQQLGADIDGEAVGDRSGRSVSLSADGTVIAIGATGNGANGNRSGHVRIYGFDQEANAWQQLGADIDGEAAGDRSGESVSLSADGAVIAIGARSNDGNGDRSGHVRIYGYDQATDAWQQLGAEIDGEAAGDQSGVSVSLSADGSVVAIGAYLNDGNEEHSGHVRVYSLFSPPVAGNVSISGEPVVNELLNVSYTYTDKSGNAESGTSFQWYSAEDQEGTNEVAISGADQPSYTLTTSELGKFLRVRVIPSNTKGSGEPVFSAYVGPVKQGQTITFDALSGKVYGEEPFEFTASSDVGLSLTYESSDTTVVKVEGNIATIVNAGSVNITASQPGNEIYLPAEAVTQTLRIAQAPLLITAEDKQINKGEALPDYTIVFEGFVNDEDSTVLTAAPQVSSSATANSERGTYAIVVEGAAADNYDITHVDGTLTITGPVYALNNTLTFDELMLGISQTQTLSLENTGDGAWHIEEISLPEGYTIDQRSLTVAPGATQEVVVTFAPEEAKSYEGLMSITSNNGVDEITLTGSGVIVTSVDDAYLDADEVSVYPNPATALLTIDLSKVPTTIKRLRMVDLGGRVLWQQGDVQERLLTVDVSGYGSGTYLLLIETSQGKEIKKILIEER